MRVLAIDPGRDKCGLAVVDDREGGLAQSIVPTSVIAEVVRQWTGAHRPDCVVLGNGTGSGAVRQALAGDDAPPVHLVAERHTTERARQRFFQANPPRGWRRLLPRGLLTPPVPVDDYAALLIGEDYVAAQERGRPPEQ